MMRVTLTSLLLAMGLAAVEARIGAPGRALEEELPMLEVVGNNGVFEVYPLGLCQGECDSDDDCAEGLFCFQREAGAPVPGCQDERPGFESRNDYCVPIPVVLPEEVELPEEVDPEFVDQVDAEYVMTTAPSLSFNTSDIEVVVNKAEEFPGEVGTLTLVGQNGMPERVFPLGLCQGDCDNDNECEGDLICYQRNEWEEVPGCTGNLASISDYCVRPPPPMIDIEEEVTTETAPVEEVATTETAPVEDDVTTTETAPVEAEVTTETAPMPEEPVVTAVPTTSVPVPEEEPMPEATTVPTTSMPEPETMPEATSVPMPDVEETTGPVPDAEATSVPQDEETTTTIAPTMIETSTETEVGTMDSSETPEVAELDVEK